MVVMQESIDLGKYNLLGFRERTVDRQYIMG
jgi:hypothetical protein